MQVINVMNLSSGTENSHEVTPISLTSKSLHYLKAEIVTQDCDMLEFYWIRGKSIGNYMSAMKPIYRQQRT